jgi:anti-anti-sigma regulatory factor
LYCFYCIGKINSGLYRKLSALETWGVEAKNGLTNDNTQIKLGYELKLVIKPFGRWLSGQRRENMNIELHFENNVATMKIEGILTSDNSYLLQDRLNEVLRSDVRLLEMDLMECRNISSTGIGKILLFYKDFIAKAGEIEVIRCSHSVYELFSMLKLNQLFTVNLG